MPRFLVCLLMLAVALAWHTAALALDISNPLKLAFVADRQADQIDVIDLKQAKVVFTIETEFRADQMVVAPYSPTLLYTNIEHKTAVFYDLSSRQAAAKIELAMVPRHLVMDTAGQYAGVSDDQGGGFVLLSMTDRKVQFTLVDFPATGDVLFDPNEVDIYYTNSATGSLGQIDMQTYSFTEMSLSDAPQQALSSPSRSLDGRQLYVANQTDGEVYNINAFSKIIFKTFNTGKLPARPYTTPQGAFLYLMDEASGRLVTVEQGSFRDFAETRFEAGVDAVAVGQFDRYNLFMSTHNPNYYFYDNVRKARGSAGVFAGQPLTVRGSADGHTAYVPFSNLAKMAMVDLEDQTVRYFPATRNGAGAFAIGLSNNVCH